MMKYINTVQYHSNIRKQEIMPSLTTGKIVEMIIPRKARQTGRSTLFQHKITGK